MAGKRLVPAAVAAAAGVAACAAGERPNIILMMADDLGWGDPSYNGGWIDTPALDAMAAEGLRFDRFYSASAVCSPTRASCLTGRHPLRVGVPNANAGRLGADETPLSEVLAGIGYATGHFGKWHLGTLTTLRRDSNRGAPGNAGDYSPPWQHGYGECFATEAKVPTYHPMRRAVNGLPEPLSFADPNFYGTYYWAPPPDPGSWPDAAEGVPIAVGDNLSGDDSRAIMDRVVPFVRGAVAAGDPFFAVVWFHTPHKPLPDPEGSSGVDSADAYTGAIVGMDGQIARLRSELESLGVEGNTMFWFCSDNGPEDGVGRSGPYRARKRSLHEGGVRVPGILVWPEKLGSPRSTDFPAVTSDYYPTILDYLCVGVPGQKPIDGISLRGVIEGGDAVRRQPIGFNYTTSRSWVNQRYKLISKDSGSTWELYDLLADPSEQSDIAAQNPGLVARMRAEFLAWQAAVDADTDYVPPADDPLVVLSTAGVMVDGEFSVSVDFSGDVTGLVAGDFVITNGVAGDLSGGGASYTLAVTPADEGGVTVQLPAGSVLDGGANPNLPSNVLSVVFVTGPSPGACTAVIDDHFDGGKVGGWISQGNAVAATHSITGAASLLRSEVVPNAANSNRGIASTLDFDPVGGGGFTLTFVVDRVAQSPDANGFFLGVVGDNQVFYRDGSTRNFGLTFFGQEDRTASAGGFGLNYGDNFGAAGAERRLADSDALLTSFQDGFTASIRADVAGWAYEIVGMQEPAGTAAVFMGSGTWAEAGTTFSALFGADASWFVVTSNQHALAGAHSVSIDRIRLVSGDEGAPERISFAADPTTGDSTIRWAAVEGRRYGVERSDTLGDWTALGEVTARSRFAEFVDDNGGATGGRSFYRVRPRFAETP